MDGYETCSVIGVLFLVALGSGCSRSNRTVDARDGAPSAAAAGNDVQGQIAGQAFHARSAVWLRSRQDLSPELLLFESKTSCDRWGAAMLFERHVRVRNMTRKGDPGRQTAGFDLCVRGDGGEDDLGPLDCRIQGSDAWIEVLPGREAPGANVHGRLELTRRPDVPGVPDGRLAGSFDAVVCDPRGPAGVRLEEQGGAGE